MTNTGKCPFNKLNALTKVNALLKNSLKNCTICPRKCGVDRVAGKLGYCRAPYNPVIYSYLPHHGEEPPLSGTKGSGTIFFTFCNMKCVYCQNYYFSQLENGREISIKRLAEIMLDLQKNGCHNINLVSPSHYIAQILMALEISVKNGLRIPIVYNTSGFDRPDTIKLLSGIIDIYLPDMRYSEDKMAKIYSDANDYVRYNRECVSQMQAQVGDLAVNGAGIAMKGLIIRLLVLPNDISGTKKSLKFIKENISRNAYLSLMSQYYPTFKAHNFKEISRGVTPDEYENIVDELRFLGLNNGWTQEGPDKFDPRFFGTNIKPA